MEYFEEFNFNNPNTTNKEQLLFESDESEFDAFEHHLSQYEHKDEELFSDDEELMEHDGHRTDRSEDDNQISLATSFCKNTQTLNDNFLDGVQFNGDQLLDPFSEDKFIKCKYSEDFFVEPTAASGRPLFSESESELFNSEQCLNDKQHAEERSSEDERVIENRRRHYLEFISTIPKVCTPSVCGLMRSAGESPSNEQTLNEQPLNDQRVMNRLSEANEEILFEDDEHELVTSTQKDPASQLADRFNWSIDQMATLNPVDISINERRYRRFKDFESDQHTQRMLSKENEAFFSQGTIAPSPTRRVFKNIGLGDKSMHDVEERSLTNEKSLMGERSVRKDESMRGKRPTGEKETGKDSGNYSGEEQRETMTNVRKPTGDQFEFSFMRHHPCNKRISNIEFDCDFDPEEHVAETPNLCDDDEQKSFSFHLPERPSEWANLDANLDFKPASSKVLQQTSTPCASLFKLKEFGNQVDGRFGAPAGGRLDEQQSAIMPLQERTNSVKQKRRLFHHLSPQANQQDSDVTEGMSSIRSTGGHRSNAASSTIDTCSNSGFSVANLSNNSSSREHCLAGSDEGICESSKEVTFGSSNESSLMSVCNNNSLTPKLRKSRDSRSITKSFAERLDELDLFNDENKNLSNASNAAADHQNSTSRWMHNLTDSNCFMIKNFNNFNVHLNNSDSGCYMSNASNGSSGSDAPVRRRVLFS